MLTLDFHPTGRHFLQIPGPSPVPDRSVRAMSLPTIDQCAGFDDRGTPEGRHPACDQGLMRGPQRIYERFDCSLGTGLGKVKGRNFRIGQLGDCNHLTLMAA